MTKGHSKKQNENFRKRITIFLDADIVEFFKNRAAQHNASAYQRQINNELRLVIQRYQKAGESGLTEVENSILKNKTFLKSLKKRLEDIS